MTSALLLLLPAFFLAICISFIIVQSCYNQWKLSHVWKKKREAAKISLVNILQLTNTRAPYLPSYPTQDMLIVKNDNRKPPSESVASNKMSKSVEASFDPSQPNVLSSVVTMSDEQNSPPPCYEDLYGGQRRMRKNNSDFRFPPDYALAIIDGNSNLSQSQLQADQEASNHFSTSSCALLTTPMSSVNEADEVHLEVTPTLERQNSSAILYL